MKTVAGYILCVIGGAAIGSAITYVVCKKKIQGEADKEVDEMRKYVSETLNSILKEDDEQTSKDIPERKIQENKTKNTDYIDYSKIIKENEYSSTTDKAETQAPDDGASDLPYIITEDDWASVTPVVDKVELDYLVEDGLLVDVHNNVEDPAVVGNGNLQYLIDSTEDILYVRNERLGIDYLINKIPASTGGK